MHAISAITWRTSPQPLSPQSNRSPIAITRMAWPLSCQYVNHSLLLTREQFRGRGAAATRPTHLCAEAPSSPLRHRSESMSVFNRSRCPSREQRFSCARRARSRAACGAHARRRTACPAVLPAGEHVFTARNAAAIRPHCRALSVRCSRPVRVARDPAGCRALSHASQRALKLKFWISSGPNQPVSSCFKSRGSPSCTGGCHSCADSLRAT